MIIAILSLTSNCGVHLVEMSTWSQPWGEVKLGTGLDLALFLLVGLRYSPT